MTAWLRPLILLLPLACAAQAPACAGRSTGFGAAELACPLPASDTARHFRLQVRFSGVHDDSSAGLAAKLDGAPVHCGEGSIDRIQGDGDGSTLVCRIAADGGAQRTLVVNLLWYHAQPEGYELTPEPVSPR